MQTQTIVLSGRELVMIKVGLQTRQQDLARMSRADRDVHDQLVEDYTNLIMRLNKINYRSVLAELPLEG